MDYLYDRLQVVETERNPLSQKERLAAMEGPLLHWYQCHARILPWREDPKPYRVWVSEIMLQQTRVEAVKPYFERFMKALPDIGSLALVQEDVLLKLWEGLGYYNRARNLQKAAKVLMERYGGELPASYEELLTLPGIGSYTAGAIASIAYGVPVPAVDGNVLRVISRVTGSRQDILKQSSKSRMEKELCEIMPKGRASQYNQGLIEIGAIICVPNGRPKCGECPLASICVAKKEGLTDVIPVKSAKKPRRAEDMTVFLIEWQDQVAIRKRSEKGLLASLYEFPNVSGHIKVKEVGKALGIGEELIQDKQPLGASKHIFSHVEWNMIGYRVVLKGEAPGFVMVPKREIFEKYPLPNAFIAYTKQIK